MLSSTLEEFFAVAVYVERGGGKRRFPSVFHDFTPDKVSARGVSGDGLGSPSNVGEHGDQGIGWRLEAPGLDGRCAVRRENLQLLLGIGAQIGLGALDAGMAESQCDFANVPCRRERVHCAGMAQHVRCYALSKD